MARCGHGQAAAMGAACAMQQQVGLQPQVFAARASSGAPAPRSVGPTLVGPMRYIWSVAVDRYLGMLYTKYIQLYML